jgi:hypothetical protein
LDIQQQHNTHLRCVMLAAPVEEEHRPTHATTTMTHAQAVWRRTAAVYADDICASHNNEGYVHTS